MLLFYGFSFFFTCRYAIVWEKGYQEFDAVESAVTSKLKGVIFTNDSRLDDKYRRVWDVSDYVVPPQVQTEKATIMFFWCEFWNNSLF